MTEKEKNSDVSAEIQQLIKQAEDIRLQKSKQYVFRRWVYYITIPSLIAGTSSYFIWVLLMGGSMITVLGALGVSVLVTVLLVPWTKIPLKQYYKEFKTSFMPAMAQAMGGLKFYPTSGISVKLIAASGLLPPHSLYTAEDSFRGLFKNIELTITEVRMYGKKQKEDHVFEGIVVALKTPKPVFKGHTIITSDHRAIKRWAGTRWRKLPAVEFKTGIPAGDFKIFSNFAQEAQSLADLDFMELLHKLSDMFGDAPISSAFYKGSRVLLMIHCADNMFEPGDINIPVTNMGYETKCQKEIEQILTVIDVLDVYEPDSAPAPVEEDVSEEFEKEEKVPG